MSKVEEFIKLMEGDDPEVSEDKTQYDRQKEKQAKKIWDYLIEQMDEAFDDDDKGAGIVTIETMARIANVPHEPIIMYLTAHQLLGRND